MSKIITSSFRTPFGELIIGSHNGELCLCDWKYRKMRKAIDERLMKGLQANMMEADDETIGSCKDQLSLYFNGELKNFDLPLKLIGSDFQKSVWNQLERIPYGQTQSYLELSKMIGNPKAIRAVATANGANALSIIIPCHRIVGSDGSLMGYAGGLNTKKRLIALESRHSGAHQTRLFDSE